ncbi:MAG: hypothetical protein DWQ31_15590 [Planctomycetota bacterium]|nr:MAG: hypothetical protein DWQ31_15590 [Planctomycetota bacterium]REJ94880.1 MAG: hypothetical protein DWQ35_07360 [Planctomycetota bacterium]REK42470.1 MAG: hypothetical protein DWQ46_13350 [Planctomycetota bacterium]
MATDDYVIQFGAAAASVASAAGRRFVESAHTPGIRQALWLFDDSAAEYVDVPIFLSRRYRGGDVAIRLALSATTATAPDQFRFEAAFLRLTADMVDFDDASGLLSFQGISPTVPTAVGRVVFPEITFAASQLDGLQSGEAGLLRIRRDPAHVDDAGVGSGDAELWESFLSSREF